MGDPNLDQEWSDRGEVKSDEVIWKDENGKLTNPPSGGLFGIGATHPKRYSRVTFANGETWDIPEDENDPTNMVDYNASLGNAWRAANKPPIPTTRQGPDQNEYQWSAETKQWGPAPGMPVSKSKQEEWSTGSTSSPYMLRQKPDGSMEQMPNPNYVPPRESQPPQWRPGEYEGTAWQRAQFDYDKQQDEIKRQQFEQQQTLARRQAAWKMASETIGHQLQATPMAQIPGQTHFLGFEPGGIQSRIAELSGRQYDPNQYKVPIIQYDPEEAWRRATATMGR